MSYKCKFVITSLGTELATAANKSAFSVQFSSAFSVGVSFPYEANENRAARPEVNSLY